jgi:glycosyl hydrolase family 39 (putative alpha-L-iduronidase)
VKRPEPCPDAHPSASPDPLICLDVFRRPVTQQRLLLDRRHFLASAGSGTALSVVGGVQTQSTQAADPVSSGSLKRVSITDSGIPEGAPLGSADFGLVGVFDVDWLLDPRFTRLLDNFAASPGAFTGMRFFGALNSGEREDTLPTGTGSVWRRREETPDFSITLNALDALVSRGIVPFVTLSFFPFAVSASPVVPPQDFSLWAKLVQAFLTATVVRFGTKEVARWRFEVWNEPNFRPFWAGNFDQYLNLYRVTSEAVSHTGYPVRLGGPALVYTPDSDGIVLIERFLRFLADEVAVQCNFISYHRKGAWFLDQDAPWLAGLQDAAEQIAQIVLRLAPGRVRGLELINNEADMKVGFAQPFEPRLTERFPAWLAASLMVHETLSAKYAMQGMRFLAASDNANQHLIRSPFDGRRSVMTRASNLPDDLLKLPVYAFYELLRLLGGRRATVVAASADAFFPSTDLLRLATVDENQVSVLLTSYPDRHVPEDPGGRGWVVDYTLKDIPWPRINAVWFCVDHAHTNPLVAAGGAGAAAMLEGPEIIRRVRTAQELGVLAPMQSGLSMSKDGVFQDSVDLAPFATKLLWITPFSPDRPAAPTWLAAEASHGNAVLRWIPAREASFYTYEVFRIGADRQPGPRLSPLPLRSALWVDTAPPPGTHVYGIRTVTASGIPSVVVSGRPVRI